MALRILHLGRLAEANIKIRGGLIGAPQKLSKQGVVLTGLVGEDLTLTSPSGSHTFVAGALPGNALTFQEVKTQLEAAIASLRVGLVEKSIFLEHTTAGTAVTMGAVDEPARAILGFSNPTGGVVIAGQALNDVGGAEPNFVSHSESDGHHYFVIDE